MFGIYRRAARAVHGSPYATACPYREYTIYGIDFKPTFTVTVAIVLRNAYKTTDNRATNGRYNNFFFFGGKRGEGICFIPFVREIIIRIFCFLFNTRQKVRSYRVRCIWRVLCMNAI